MIRLDTGVATTLTITPQMRMAVKILQMNNLELTAFLHQKEESNPFLQVEGTDPFPLSCKEDRSLRRQENFTRGLAAEWEVQERVAAPVSLRDHLITQLTLLVSNPEGYQLGERMIDALDFRGYLSPQEKAHIIDSTGLSQEQGQELLRKMQHFSPTGIFASSLAECFKIQLEDSGELTATMQTIIDNLELFKRGQFEKLQQLCQTSIAEIRRCVQKLRMLTPYPALSFSSEPLLPRIPDLIAKKVGTGDWQLSLNPETQPVARAHRAYYADVFPRIRSREEQKFAHQHFSQALWLETVLHQRAATLMRVTHEILRQQEAFFEQGIHGLKPLRQRQIADILDVHESTVSRVLSSKSVETPSGVLDLSFFFPSAVSSCQEEKVYASSSVASQLQEFIRKEAPLAPLSDDQLAALLFQQNRITMARRTVTKYRNALRIPTAAQRRQAHRIFPS
ncbi:MAG: RNA polymerase factor sigma-54 [Holosporales bacterium]|nr:RNA polymerase factor sigma-54 [Holosporales bacterium]